MNKILVLCKNLVLHIFLKIFNLFSSRMDVVDQFIELDEDLVTIIYLHFIEFWN